MNWVHFSWPIIGGLIGWMTNYVAVKMLFRPKKPINLGVVKVQGVFPKRHKAFAKKIGNLVGEQLFSFEDLTNHLKDEQHHKEVVTVIDAKIDAFLREKLIAQMPMLAMVMGDELRNKIKTTLVEEFELALPEIIDGFAGSLQSSLDIKKEVEKRVAEFSLDQLESVMLQIMSKEFRFIELLGAILGALIGAIQTLFFVLS